MTFHSLVAKWLPVIDSDIGVTLLSDHDRQLCACMLESQARLNKESSDISISHYQAYALPIIRKFFGDICSGIKSTELYHPTGSMIYNKSFNLSCIGSSDILAEWLEDIILTFIIPHIRTALITKRFGNGPWFQFRNYKFLNGEHSITLILNVNPLKVTEIS